MEKTILSESNLVGVEATVVVADIKSIRDISITNRSSVSLNLEIIHTIVVVLGTR